MGLSPAPHAELADPSAWLQVRGPDPDGYMTMSEVIAFLSQFASLSGVPVRTNTNVTSVTRVDDGYHVATSNGDVRCRTLVIASGACNLPSVPSIRSSIPAVIEQFTPFDYRNPDLLPEGSVLVVGASATGIQLAAEIHQSGRPVTVSVGEHVRLPRTYRGRDVLWWMDVSGVWNQRFDEIDDLTRARRLPSPQLVGTPDRTTLDLNALSAMGIELVGRFAGVRDGRALFSGGLRNVFSLADLKMERLLDAFDEWARVNARAADVNEPERFEPTRVPPSSRLQLDLRNGEIRSMVSAQGFGRTTAGCRCRSWMRKDTCATKGASSTRRACTRSACRCYAGASRASSTAWKTTLAS